MKEHKAPLSKVAAILSIYCFIALAGYASDDGWYEDSYIHTHVSLSLPVEHIDFIKKQIEEVRPDAIQFHTHDLRLVKEIKDENIDDKLGFKVVATINHAGVWYPHYADDDRYVYRINADGTFAGRWTRKHLCFNTPVVYNKIIPEKYTDLPREIQPDQIWIDESIITVNVCYCKNCIEKYNKQYGKEPPRELTDENFGEWEQWVKFHRDTFVEWMKAIVEAAHSVDPDILVTINHAYFVEQPEPLPDFIENLSGDVHNDPLELGLYAKYADSIDAPFDLMPGLGSDIWAGIRPKTVEQIYNDVSLIAAYGGRWNIGEFPTDFLTLRKEEKYQGPGYRRADIYLDLAKKGADFARQRQPFCMDSRSVPYAAILHSARTHYSHVIFNTNRVKDKAEMGKTSDGTFRRSDTGRINSRVYWPDNKPIMDDLVGAYEALVENHVQFDIVHSKYLRDNIDRYKMIILAEQAYLEDETVEAVKDFVRKGGSVLASGSTVNADLKDMLGVDIKQDPDFKRAEYILGDEQIAFSNFTTVKANGARVMQKTADHAYPVVTANRYGQGVCFYIAGDIFKEYYRRSGYSHKPIRNNASIRKFVNDVLEKLLPRGKDAIDFKASPWFEITLMQNRDNYYVHVINRSINWKQKKDSDQPVIISFPAETEPKWAKLQPGDENVDFSYKNGEVKLVLDPSLVKFHKIIQIKK